MKIFSLQMTVGWIFIAIILFCFYIFFGLYITEKLETFVQQILGWTIYTLLWITFLNVFLLSYFWSVVRTKTGPYGIRGPEGDQGKQGSKGECSVNMLDALCMQQLNQYIDDLYKAKTNKSILNVDTQKFPCEYLNEKIKTISTSRQFQVINGNLSNENKPNANLINYLKSIWHSWFNLLYNATSPLGSWFTDEYGDENSTWVGNNPFNEIKKYDVYYWGVTRDFRPLKAEICRSTTQNNNSSSKLPRPQLAKTPYEKVARLKVIQSNSYKKMGFNEYQTGNNNVPVSWWSPNINTSGNDTYYPVGDVMAVGSGNPRKNGQTKVGNDISYSGGGGDGPDIKTILVSGDVVDPISYTSIDDTYAGTNIYSIQCPGGYTSLGDVSSSNGNFANYKCVPSDCVEKIADSPIRRWTRQGGNDDYVPGSNTWNKYNKWKDWLRRTKYTWYSSLNVLNNWDSGQNDANYTNGYNLMRKGGDGTFYKLKKSCLQRTPNRDIPPLSPEPPPSTKDLEPNNDEMGIGWYGHPYKLDPKYSIFSYLNLIPEGMIVNSGTGQRFYIVHVEGDEINLFNIMTYNKNTNKYDNALQAVDYELNSNWPPPGTSGYDDYIGSISDPNEPVSDKGVTYNQTKRVIETKFNKFEQKQRWIIMLNPQNKKLFTLKNAVKQTSLYVGQEPRDGNIEFSTVDLNNNNYTRDPAFQYLEPGELQNRTSFNFISTFGTQLNIIDE